MFFVIKWTVLCDTFQKMIRLGHSWNVQQVFRFFKSPDFFYFKLIFTTIGTLTPIRFGTDGVGTSYNNYIKED